MIALGGNGGSGFMPSEVCSYILAGAYLLGGRSVRVASVGVVCGVAYSVCRSEGKDGSDDREPQLHTHYRPLLVTGLRWTGLEWIMGDWLF